MRRLPISGGCGDGRHPGKPTLSAPTFRALVEAADGELVLGSQAWMDREAMGVIVAR